MEHEIEGTWQKFLNNDGLEVGGEENQFKLKALAFAHWTFFVTYRVSWKFPHFQENQFQHSNWFASKQSTEAN